MKTIMVFGDSLTWGTNADAQRRHAFCDRWPNVLQSELGQDFHIVAEGLGGRTTIYDDLDAPVDKNGARALPILLGSHNPLDLLVIMLGANDLKPHLCGSAEGAAKGIQLLVESTMVHPYNWGAAPPRILIVSPPHFCKKADGSGPEGGRSIAESEKLAGAYSAVAAGVGAAFWDAASVARASPVDGVHLDAQNSRAIGKAIAPIVRNILAG